MSSHHTPREHLLCPTDEYAFVQNLCINPRTNVKHLVKMLVASAGSGNKSVIISEEEAITPKATQTDRHTHTRTQSHIAVCQG